MKSGISCDFNAAIDLYFAEAFMDMAFPQQFNTGAFEVLVNGTSVGLAGDLGVDIVKAIPKGSRLCLMAELDNEQQDVLQSELKAINKAISSRNQTLAFVCSLDHA